MLSIGERVFEPLLPGHDGGCVSTLLSLLPYFFRFFFREELEAGCNETGCVDD
jgi:hypothetical protein